MIETLQEIAAHLYEFDELIRIGGYTALVAIVFAETGLLFGFFLPGDSLLVTAGLVAAAQGVLDIRKLIVFLCLAAIAGDSVGYAIGRHLGARLYQRSDSWLFRREHLVKTQQFYATYGAKTIVLARFVPIVRTFAPTVAGVAKMHYRTFLTYNVIGGIGWVLSMTLAGYWLGQSIPNLEHHLHWVIAIVIVVSFLPILHEWRQARRRAQPAPGAPVPPAHAAEDP